MLKETKDLASLRVVSSSSVCQNFWVTLILD
ncbi:hypothetical protein F383_31861 [Gossypium arboreum]|uniref:Uncharacterized protein n=1 Tax=Gossypium arboreum TaxID=29729 RepID=A0A0B0N2Z4_GOSAR|nr:hypothetical protein F383_31861 [Gossypium arboreum]